MITASKLCDKIIILRLTNKCQILHLSLKAAAKTPTKNKR